MDTRIKRLVAGVALAGAVTVGTAGAAFAADGGSTGSTGSTAPSAQAGKAHPALRRAVRRGAVKVISDTLGVTRADLRAALKGGQSVSEYATSLQKDPQTVSAALVTAADAKVDQLVGAGKLTADRAATIKGKVPDRVAKLMDHHFGQAAPAPAGQS